MAFSEPSQITQPLKFFLIFGQVLLLVVVLQMRSQHIYWGIGFNYGDDSPEFQSADSQLVGVSACFIFFLGFEFILMVIGMSLLANKYNLFQIFLHMLGCLFTTWFVLDSWRYSYIWHLWVFFGLFPFLLEIGIIVSTVRFNINLRRNEKGISR